MGSGTDVAIEGAGITLLKGDLMGIARARRLSKAAMALSSVSVIANALRLRRLRFRASLQGASSEPIAPPSPSSRAIWRVSVRVNFSRTPAPMPSPSSTMITPK